jgi:hypothetical protein
VDKIREASMEELIAVVPQDVAEAIKAHLD